MIKFCKENEKEKEVYLGYTYGTLVVCYLRKDMQIVH